jgi:small subunit ribosomal protein S10
MWSNEANVGNRLYNSKKEAEIKAKRMEPTTVEEAKRVFEEMKRTPDHHTMLHMYKRAGVEPIKLAKYVSPTLTIFELSF